MKGDYGKIPLEVSASGQGSAPKRGWQCFVVGFFGVVSGGFPGVFRVGTLYVSCTLPISSLLANRDDVGYMQAWSRVPTRKTLGKPPAKA